MRSRIKSLIKIDAIKNRAGKVARFFKPFYRQLTNKRSDLYIWARNVLITEQYVGKRVAVYNGRRFLSFFVRSSMVGHRFGEFSITKKLGSIHPPSKHTAKAGGKIKKGNVLFTKRKTNNVKKLAFNKRKSSKLQLR